MSGEMHQKQATAEARPKVPAPPQNLSALYKPVGIQAVTAATVCKAPQPKPRRRATVVPEDS